MRRLDDCLVRVRDRVPDLGPTCQMVRRHRMEARIRGVLGDVVNPQPDVVGQRRGIGAVDDAGFKCGEDFGEIHHDG